MLINQITKVQPCKNYLVLYLKDEHLKQIFLLKPT